MNDFHDQVLTKLELDFVAQTFEILFRKPADIKSGLSNRKSKIKGAGMRSFSSTVDVEELVDHAKSGTVSWVKDSIDTKRLVIFLVSGALTIGYTEYSIE